MDKVINVIIFELGDDVKFVNGEEVYLLVDNEF